MSTVRIEENKVWYKIRDGYSDFYCKVSKKSLQNLQKLLIDCLKLKIPTSIYDCRYHETRRWFDTYGCKGYTWSIRKDRVADVLLSISVYKGEIRNKQDIANALGFKTYCKSVDKILKSLPLQSVAMLYNKLRKEITYGKTSSSNKT